MFIARPADTALSHVIQRPIILIAGAGGVIRHQWCCHTLAGARRQGEKKTTFYKSEILGLKLASVTAAVKFAGAPAGGANAQESSVKTAISRTFPEGRP